MRCCLVCHSALCCCRISQQHAGKARFAWTTTWNTAHKLVEDVATTGILGTGSESDTDECVLPPFTVPHIFLPVIILDESGPTFPRRMDMLIDDGCPSVLIREDIGNSRLRSDPVVPCEIDLALAIGEGAVDARDGVDYAVGVFHWVDH